MMLHKTIRNDDFQRNTALQHYCDIVSNVYNIVPTLQHCVVLKITFSITGFYPAWFSFAHFPPFFQVIQNRVEINRLLIVNLRET